MAIKQEVNAPLLLTIGMVSGFLLIIVVIGIQAWWLWAEQGELRAKYDTARNFELSQVLDEQHARLSTASLNDGRATIPIDQAMDVIVQSRGALPATQPAR